ncbi:transposase [Mesorhizobium sp. YC-39]|uniref:transposase n=1 Tax=unclassified Mesorhizobium TaxID=325217 RepID=UPI0021E7197A|nr:MULTISPECIES: transposase [unclassified Mesorhizobium]MCV3211655.1 transposase [Mesorhizobium sp. YC-2]MCV3233441.1 transposase [Mesorhizobium sp. YC-39]
MSRHCDSRRQLAACAGLAAIPWKGGRWITSRGRKSGNPKLRTKLVQMACWLWVRHQPCSTPTLCLRSG